MSSQGSVTRWLSQFKRGDSQATSELWQRYQEWLTRQADRKLRHAPRRVTDEEDVALGAFFCFCKGAADGEFPRLNNREDVQQVLAMLVARKAIDQLRRDHAQVRGGGEVRGESALANPNRSDSDPPGWGRVASPELTPDSMAALADWFREILDRLQDEELRRIILERVSGHSNSEIAEHLGVSVRSVERRLNIIRRMLRPGESEE